MLNNVCYKDITDIIKNKYWVNPIVIRFSQVSQMFFSKMARSTQPMTALIDRGNGGGSQVMIDNS